MVERIHARMHQVLAQADALIQLLHGVARFQEIGHRPAVHEAAQHAAHVAGGEQACRSASAALLTGPRLHEEARFRFVARRGDDQRVHQGERHRRNDDQRIDPAVAPALAYRRLPFQTAAFDLGPAFRCQAGCPRSLRRRRRPRCRIRSLIVLGGTG
ncbi:hypothetical protein D3C86_681870 [compost metagenome]